MPKAERRFYEPLVLLETLDQVQGEHIEEDPIETVDHGTRGIMKQRRMMLKFLCEMCDYRKGGETVTAALLERTPQGPVMWVASSEDLHKKTLDFLKQVITMLKRQTHHDEPDLKYNLEDRLFFTFTTLHVPRLKKTMYLLQKHTRTMLDWGSRMVGDSGEARAYEDWLRPFQGSFKDIKEWQDICQHAENARKSLLMNIEDSVYAPMANEQDAPRLVRHYVGRLASPLRAAKYLADLARKTPVFDDLEIKTVDCGGPIDAPTVRRTLTLDDIAGRMLPAHGVTHQEVREDLATLNDTIRLKQEVIGRLKDPNFRPRVHAELAVLEAAFDASDELFDDDRFIACSKRACFCCYHYISSHPGRFSRPSCHNKVWRNWRAPDVTSQGRKRQEAVMQKVTAELRGAVLDKIKKRSPRSRYRTDSSTGMTLSLAMEDTDTLDSDSQPEAENHEMSDDHSLHGLAGYDDVSDDGGVSVLADALGAAKL